MYLSGLVVVTSIVAMIFGTYYMSANSGKYDTHLMSTNMIQTTYAICLFILLREALGRINLTTSFKKLETIISMAAGASMGIYLIHPMLLSYVRHGLFGIFLLSPSVLSPKISVPLVTALLFVVSLILVIILQKIPLIRKIVP